MGDRAMMSPLVIAGLDPAIHLSSQDSFVMDARVEPAHDIVSGERLVANALSQI